ncbi:MAG: mercuric reductase [Desulfobacteraceae bacterium]|nr:mercuric reductase [Desulfobacteraceae bacterium]
MSNKPWHFDVTPRDEHNRTLVDHVHPPAWTPPTPEPCYNLVVIGAGTAGLISALGCAGLGGKAALVERHLMGGDCLNVGCVPSKCFVRSSRAAAEMASGDRFGLTPCPPPESDFSAVMARLRRLRAHISRHDSAMRYREMGVDLFFGEAVFADHNTVTVGGNNLRFRKAVIAAGARPVRPGIEGLDKVGFMTNETVFNLTELPRRLVVIGGGPIGCELAQGFRRLGARVTIVQHSRFLPREDPEASALLARVFEDEGIRILPGARVVRVEASPTGKRVTIANFDGQQTVEADEILIGAGRKPNVEGLGLTNAGVTYDKRKGIVVDDFLRTTNPDIFAAGDICMAWKFTHAADAGARIAVQNALFLGRKRVSALNMPWCTYTDPEIAHVGLYEADAEARGIPTDTFRVEMAEVDRAVTDGDDQGFVKVLVKKGTDRILGATIVAAHAGELISEISVAMAAKAGLKTLGTVIHPYPTQAEAIKRVADAYNRTRLTPRAAGLLKWWLKRQRRC